MPMLTNDDGEANSGLRGPRSRLRVVIAPQSFKGCLTAAQVGAAIAAGVQAVHPEISCTIVPVADGGEGTMQALLDATGGHTHELSVTGPLGRPVRAAYCIVGDGKTAVIEMAAASGLPLVPSHRRNPLLTTTFGTGQLIQAALTRGCRRMIIGIGGSATNDGGAGMVQALGGHLLDEADAELPFGGAALSRLARIDVRSLDPRLSECEIEVACDVSNPLLGPSGASAVYGPQKGATPAGVNQLDAALAHYAEILKRDLGRDVVQIPGSGAAGGLGAGLLAFLNVRLRPGAEIVLEAVRLREKLVDADLVFTGEGRLDSQTAFGKSVSAVARLAKERNIPVIAVGGSLGKGYKDLYEQGIDALVPIPDRPLSMKQAIADAAPLISGAVERTMRLLRIASIYN